MVNIKINAEGQTVTSYEGNPEYGYAILSSTEDVFQNGWLQSKDRSCIVKGATAQLEKFFTAGKQLPGKIAVTECTEDNVPAKFAMQFDKTSTFEENIDPFIKRAGKDGPVLMSEGRRIVRFTEYDPSGHNADVRVQHDNADEVKAFNLTKKSAEADLS